MYRYGTEEWSHAIVGVVGCSEGKSTQNEAMIRVPMVYGVGSSCQTIQKSHGDTTSGLYELRAGKMISVHKGRG